MTVNQILVEMLRADRAMREKFLKEHAADSSGHCPLCPAGGSSSGRMLAPCNLLLAAEAAQRGKV
jgi:hypothetical protein